MGEWRLVQLGCSMRSNNEDGGEWDAMARLSFTARIHPRPKEPAKDKRKMMSCGFFKIFLSRAQKQPLCSLVYCHVCDSYQALKPSV